VLMGLATAKYVRKFSSSGTPLWGLVVVVEFNGESTACKFLLSSRSGVGGGEHHCSRSVLLAVA
jgi:hypothetical protein